MQDTRTAPVPEIVTFRCDFADWLKRLNRRDRRIAETLALGNRTSDVAKRFNVSAGPSEPTSPRAGRVLEAVSPVTIRQSLVPA